jgi:cbb3-type cytochrome oxidase subunit 3
MKLTRALSVLVVLALVSAAIVWWRHSPRPKASAAAAGRLRLVSDFAVEDAADGRRRAMPWRDSAGGRRRTEAYGTYRLPHVRLSTDLDGLQAALGAAGEPPGLAPPAGAVRTASGYTSDEVRALALHAIARVSAAGAGTLDLIEVESATKSLVSGSALIEYSLVFMVWIPDRNEAVKLVADMAFDTAPRLLRARLYSALAMDPADPAGLSAQVGGRPPAAGDATPWKPALAFDPQRDREPQTSGPPKK